MVTTQSEILQTFPGLSLKEMDAVSFMSRVDSKYIFPVSMLVAVLSDLAGDYKVLDINSQREFRYSTVYFDTPDYKFFNQHQTGKLERDKVRLRTYETNSLTYLEVKHKTNKGRTVKSRIRSNNAGLPDDDGSRQFLQEKLAGANEFLHPVITSLFTRITLVNNNFSERVTVDFNLAYTNNDGRRIELPNIAIAEIKRNRSSNRSVFFSVLKKNGIRQTAFSKYCLGAAILNGVSRKNNLKPILLKLKKIDNESSQFDVALRQS
jgi:hypothetical protein